MERIGFGGSCHWCTEAIFQSLKGVYDVEQGWIASEGEESGFSEAVIVTYDPATITLETLIAVHLHTHSCTSEHSMRSKYRSAVYTLDDNQVPLVKEAIGKLQVDFDLPIITQIIPFKAFKVNQEQYLNYYYSDPEKLFCQNVVKPKLRLLLDRFGKVITEQAKQLL
ncbi:MAG: peptide-methionine (S)-S-oxide reductase [Mucilaginibacter sp.]|uniref:peptide-methionine (S)-S-oxide reductase n=1 Tax=Mucilaginibacter sp. TaxID=1882438 RepID=UPI0032636A1E